MSRIFATYHLYNMDDLFDLMFSGLRTTTHDGTDKKVVRSASFNEHVNNTITIAEEQLMLSITWDATNIRINDPSSGLTIINPEAYTSTVNGRSAGKFKSFTDAVYGIYYHLLDNTYMGIRI